MYFQLPSPPPRSVTGVALTMMTADERSVPVLCAWRNPTMRSTLDKQSRSVVFCWWNIAQGSRALELLVGPGDLAGCKEALVRVGSFLLYCPHTLAVGFSIACCTVLTHCGCGLQHWLLLPCVAEEQSQSCALELCGHPSDLCVLFPKTESHQILVGETLSGKRILSAKCWNPK